MARYIDADALIKALQADFDREGEQAYEMAKLGVADASVKYSHGQFCFLNAIERVKDTPTVDVVPKSEVESINPIQEAIEQKKKENKESALGVLNELLDEKDAEIKRLKAENKTLQGKLVIWKQDRFNLYQRLELYKIARGKVAREIFEDIRKTCGYSVAEHDGVVLYHTKCYSIMATKLDELEKKFVPDTNVGHKMESEGEHGRDSNIQSSS